MEKIQDARTTRKLITNSKLLIVFKSRPQRNTPMAKRFSHYKETHYKQQIISSVQILTTAKDPDGKDTRCSHYKKTHYKQQIISSVQISTTAKHPDGKDTRCSHYKETHYKQQIIVVFKSLSERNTRWKRFERYKQVFALQGNSSEAASYNLVLESSSDRKTRMKHRRELSVHHRDLHATFNMVIKLPLLTCPPPIVLVACIQP